MSGEDAVIACCSRRGLALLVIGNHCGFIAREIGTIAMLNGLSYRSLICCVVLAGWGAVDDGNIRPFAVVDRSDVSPFLPPTENVAIPELLTGVVIALGG